MPETNIIQLDPSPSSGVPHAAKPVPEAIAKTSFKDDFTSVDDFNVEQLPPQKETEKKAEEKVESVKEEKVEEKVEEKELEKEEKIEQEPEKEEKKEEKKEEEPKKEPLRFLKPPKGQEREVIQKTGKVVRDYNGYSQDQVRAFKQMSDEAYTLTKQAVDENRELKKLEGSTYLQHEQAYVLDPQFQSLREDLSFASKEAQHWQEQLVLMDAGKPFTNLKGWDSKGNPVLEPEQQPTKREEESVRLKLYNCIQAANQINGQLQQYPVKYKQVMQVDLQTINKERSTRFPWVADAKLLDYTINVEGAGEKTVKQVKQEFTAMFPRYLHNHPAMDVASDLMVSLVMANAELSELRNGKQVEQVITEEKEKVEPTSHIRTPKQKTPVHGVKEFHDLPLDIG